MRNRATSALTVISGCFWLPVGYILVFFAVRHDFGAVLVIAASVYACVRLVRQRFTSEGRARLGDDRRASTAGLFGGLLELVAYGTAGFATLSALLYRAGVGTLKGAPLTSDELASASFTYYLWHLADSVPALKVPKTLNWTLRHPFTDHAHGGLALVYAIAVSVPTVYVATQVIGAWVSDDSEEADE